MLFRSHDQKGIEAGGGREIGDKITGDLLEGVGCAGANGGEWRDCGMCVCLVLLAGGASCDVFADIGGQARPPEFCRNELPSFEVPRVTSTFVVVTSLENGVAEGVIVRDIDTTLVGQDACLDLPVGEVGTEGERDVLVHGLEGLEDEGVTRRGGLDTVGEGYVDNVDEERWGRRVTPSLSSSDWGRRSGRRERASGPARSLPGTWTIFRSKSARSMSQRACHRLRFWGERK